MKITLKNITLKEDTIESLKNGNVDTEGYVNYIRTNIDNANYLIKAKLQSLEDLELYEALSKVFNISLDEKDILSALKSKYNKHYLDMRTLTTSMVDEEGNRIVLVGAATKNVPSNSGVIPIQVLRTIVNSYDFIVIETVKVKPLEKSIKGDRFEDYQFAKVGLDIKPEDDLFEEKTRLIGKEVKNPTVLKRILKAVEQYVQELIHQAKSVQRIGEVDESLEEVGKEYKKAYEANFTKKSIFVNGNHRKSH